MPRYRALAAGCALLLLLQPSVLFAWAMHPSCPQTPVGADNLGPNGPMRFRVDNSRGGKVLIAEGEIAAATPAALQAALARDGEIDEIWLRSPGGDAVAGNRAAEIIRASGIPMRIPAGWWCISACNFLFFGGALRSIDPGGVFGVHMATVVNNLSYQNKVQAASRSNDPDRVLALIAEREQKMAQLTADDTDVILRMGISRKLLSEVMYAQRADDFRDDDHDGKLDIGKVPVFRCLSQEEMRRYNVINVD